MISWREQDLPAIFGGDIVTSPESQGHKDSCEHKQDGCCADLFRARILTRGHDTSVTAA